ncbi:MULTISPECIES: hypothetical protein [unclassified Mesorhizobium]|uniref:hypothetical protein n=1 Tax=unclassified Mesorhizobium TaxID=325217 RepID=UPI00112C98B6|nr:MULTISPECIES: hypothetical protein [unclassified Mesorhizobium]TPJ86987.1 hypothetical protein FJ489_31060 [Mesorhizobium sp. B2-5-12]TPK19210.1 hypothetical protein FJ562_31465 [Mesorhizobium sp. B2-5-6]
MTISLESLARTIAKARHGTDAMWANYMGAAEAVVKALEAAEPNDEMMSAVWSMRTSNTKESFAECYRSLIRALTAQPDSSDEIPAFIERP